MIIFKNLHKKTVRLLFVSLLMLGVSCASLERSDLYDGHKPVAMDKYEKKVEKMTRAEIKQEAAGLLADIQVNEKKIARLEKQNETAQEEKDVAGETELVNKGASLIKVRKLLKNARHRRERMNQMSAVIRSCYSDKFDQDE